MPWRQPCFALTAFCRFDAFSAWLPAQVSYLSCVNLRLELEPANFPQSGGQHSSRRTWGPYSPSCHAWLWVNTNGTIWGRCTTQFRTYFSGDWDVHWGYGILTHGHMSARHPTPVSSELAFAFSGSLRAFRPTLRSVWKTAPGLKPEVGGRSQQIGFQIGTAFLYELSRLELDSRDIG